MSAWMTVWAARVSPERLVVGKVMVTEPSPPSKSASESMAASGAEPSVTSTEMFWR